MTSVLRCAGRQTRARALSPVLLLAGAARFRLCLVLVPARLLYWCRFAPAPVLHWYGVFASVMGRALAPRPWFKFFGSQLRHELSQAGGSGLQTFWPNGKQTNMRSVQTKCAHVVYSFPPLPFLAHPGRLPGYLHYLLLPDLLLMILVMSGCTAAQCLSLRVGMRYSFRTAAQCSVTWPGDVALGGSHVIARLLLAL